MNKVSTNLEQGQGNIEDDVQTLEDREELIYNITNIHVLNQSVYISVLISDT